MATEVLTVDGTGLANAWSLTGAGTKALAVAADDGDTSYIEGIATLQQQLTFSDATTISAEDLITNLAIRVTLKEAIPADPVTIDVGGTAQNFNGSGSYVLNTFNFAVGSGDAAWTLALINSTQVKFVMPIASGTMRITKVDAVVTFTPSNTKYLPLRGVG